MIGGKAQSGRCRSTPAKSGSASSTTTGIRTSGDCRRQCGGCRSKGCRNPATRRRARQIAIERGTEPGRIIVSEMDLGSDPDRARNRATSATDAPSAYGNGDRPRHRRARTEAGFATLPGAGPPYRCVGNQPHTRYGAPLLPPQVFVDRRVWVAPGTALNAGWRLTGVLVPRVIAPAAECGSRWHRSSARCR